MAFTLHKLGVCLLRGGQQDEAELHFRRALAIREAKLGSQDTLIEVTVQDLARCLFLAGRPAEAEVLFRKALSIREANLGRNHSRVALALQELGVCVRETGRPMEAKELLLRALSVRESAAGLDGDGSGDADDDVHVGFTNHELDRCAREAKEARKMVTVAPTGDDDGFLSRCSSSASSSGTSVVLGVGGAGGSGRRSVTCSVGDRGGQLRQV